jgi:DNA replication protein DnaC
MPSWCSIPELIVGLRADMDRERGARTWSDRLDYLAACVGTVVLDDLGREKVSDWTGEAVYVLVNGRYERKLPTIVTTNLLGPDMATSPYWPVISRLAEDGALVRLDGSDYRLRKERSA